MLGNPAKGQNGMIHVDRAYLLKLVIWLICNFRGVVSQSVSVAPHVIDIRSLNSSGALNAVQAPVVAGCGFAPRDDEATQKPAGEAGRVVNGGGL